MPFGSGLIPSQFITVDLSSANNHITKKDDHFHDKRRIYQVQHKNKKGHKIIPGFVALRHDQLF